MNKIIKLALIMPSLLFSCVRKIVVNNAFVYLVHDSCIKYGKINGEQWQSVYVNEYSTEVTAVPEEGYKFTKWSDGLLTPNRTDLATDDNDNGPVTYYAYFEKIDG